MIRRPPRSTRVRSSAASDVYKRQITIRSSDDRKLATALMTNPVVFAVELTGSGLSVQTAQLGTFRSNIAGASRSAGVRLLEVVSADESLESVFDYLVRR